MTNTDQVMLLSIRPRYAELVLSGAKTVDVRRRIPRAKWPYKILLYATGAGVVGRCRSTGLGIVNPDNQVLWLGQTGLGLEEYNQYLRGSKKGACIFLADAQRFDRPVSLVELRDILGDGFLAPRSWRYLKSVDAEKIKAAAC